ncbi:MAG: acyl-CoA dehydrogenase family protein [Actinobacteria bacterium]|nr:acyl-CoA dehydrogenase family protein [Actinomycetota bacterium]
MSSPESSSDREFRDELRAWLARHPPPGFDVATTEEEARALRAWQRTLHSGRFVGVHWPVEHGGRGASASQVAIYNQELAHAGAPPIIGRVGVTLVGPTLITHGTDEQRRRFMPRILDGADVWCQLFSEPGAGSDLAALSTRAERRADAYVVNGQKVWSSHATFADMGIALVRTDPAAHRHKGISMLAIPMDAPGVDVRPLRQITGDRDFDEVFLDDVEVPVDNLIGGESQGWQVAATTLANERGAAFIWREQVLLEAATSRLWAACARESRLCDPVVRQRLARSRIDVEIFRLHNERTLARLARGDDIGPEASIVKLFWAGASQRLYETALAVLGPGALLDPSDGVGPDAGGEWIHGLLATRANTIMGGTSEIQRTILAERVLGLPREMTAK